MKLFTKPLKSTMLMVLSSLFLVFLFSCEEEDEQTTNPPPENILEKSSELTQLLIDHAQKNISGASSCAAIEYEIDFLIYNKDFQVVDTKSIASDKQLVDFLNTLGEPLIVSLEYPVFVSIETLEEPRITSNEEFLAALQKANEDCGITTNDCTEEEFKASLTECPLYITSYNDTDKYIDFKVTFSNRDDSFTVSENGILVYEGISTISQNTDGKFLLNLNLNWEVLVGTWTVENCASFSSHDLTRAQDSMHLEGCNFSPKPNDISLACFENFEDLEIEDTDNDGKDIYDLTGVYIKCLSQLADVSVSYHSTENDAQENLNAIDTPNSYEFNLGITTVYARVFLNNDQTNYKIVEIKLGLNSSGCGIEITKDRLTKCTWEIEVLERSGLSETSMVKDWVMTFSDNFEMTYTNKNTNEVVNAQYSVDENLGTTVLELPFVSNNFESLADEWKLVECSEDRLQFDSSRLTNSTLVIKRVCK